jgi:hypothetical protein
MSTASTFGNIPIGQHAIATYMSNYNMRGQHTPDRAMTRYRHDLAKMTENNEISTGPGRWVLGVPNAYGNAAFVPTPTTINQRWGASHVMSQMKTDTESDLRNLSRPTVRTTCGQYQPSEGLALAAQLEAMPEVQFPQTASHLVDPPATLRGTGINRWEWLCENPQQDVMIPFEYLVNSQQANKDDFRVRLLSGQAHTQFVEPAVPVPRVRRAGEPAQFQNTIPGASQKPMTSSEPFRTLSQQETPGNQQWSSVSSMNRQMEASGRLAPPPLFGQFIAPH